jgi:hypothetical protein
MINGRWGTGLHRTAQEDRVSYLTDLGLPDPDAVGSSEYRAIHDTIEEVIDGNDSAEEQAEQVRAVAVAYAAWAETVFALAN